MAKLQEIIEYSKNNPTSSYAQQAFQLIQRGDFDEEARNSGIDLSFAGRPKFEAPISETEVTPLKGFVTRLQESVDRTAKSRAANIKAISDANLKGEQGFARSAAQVGGQLVGGALIDPVMNVLAAISPKIPEKMGSAISKFEEKLATPSKEGGGAIGDFVQWLSNREDFQQLAMDPSLSEPLKRDIEAINNYTALLAPGPAKKGLTTGIETGLTGAEKTVSGIGKVFAETGNIASDLKNLAGVTTEKFTGLLPDKSKMRAYFTNLDEATFKRIENPEYATKVKGVLDTLETGTKNPYLDLAQKTSDRINSLVDDAKTTFSETAKQYVKQGQTFDVGARIKEIIESVDSFKTGKDIAFKELRNAKGQLDGYELVKGRYSPYSSNEIASLNRLIDDIRSATAMNADQLIALDQKFATYYRAISDAAGPTPYHAAVMELKQQTQARIRELLSGELRAAYEKYANVSDLKTDFGNKIVGSDGYIKDSAESFLANLSNQNKGALQAKIKGYSDTLGLDLIAETQAINDAKKFMLTQAPTGGRMKDFLMSYGFGGLGAGAGAAVAGPVGAAIGGAGGASLGMKLTSPKFVGQRAIQESIAGSTPKILEPKSKTGQFIKEVSEIPNKQGGFVKNPFAESSFQGFDDLTTKFLDYTKGKTTLSRQEILDFARRPELKKGEADLLMKKLEEYGGEQVVSPDLTKQFTPKGGMFQIFKGKNYKEVLDYASKNPDYYLPSSEKQLLETIESGGGIISGENVAITLKNAEGGSIKLTPQQARYFLNAKEGVSQGTSKLPAQDFADSIRRDLLELKPVKVKEPQFENISIGRNEYESGGDYEWAKKQGLAGKNYEEVVFESPITTNGSSHFPNSKNYFAHARGDEVVEGGKKIWREQEIQSDLLQKDNFKRLNPDQQYIDSWPNDPILAEQKKRFVKPEKALARQKEIAPLEPFLNDRFGERIMRERIKEKAQKGYSKYRLPTGETIGKIEGFENRQWRELYDDIETPGGSRPSGSRLAKPENLEVGMRVSPADDINDQWIITDILGDGRFKAVPKDVQVRARQKVDDMLESVGERYSKAEYELSIKNEIENLTETFDLTGKSNPQYRRYENWGKFLKNKYGGKTVTDKQGNTWVEIDLKKEMGKLPIEAFGVLPFTLQEE